MRTMCRLSGGIPVFSQMLNKPYVSAAQIIFYKKFVRLLIFPYL